MSAASPTRTHPRLLRRLLAAPVAVAEVVGDPPGAVLLGAEEELVACAVERRQREFTTTRACARRALAALGVSPRPLLRGPGGEPVWPVGIVGSLTHGGGYRAAAVARRGDLASLGIDAEPHEPLPPGVLDQVAQPVEQDALDRLPTGICWDRLLFSAKESAYKAWFPLARRWLGFEDALVELRPDARCHLTTGTLRVRLLVPGPALPGGRLVAIHGRYAVGRGLVVTACHVPVGRRAVSGGAGARSWSRDGREA